MLAKESLQRCSSQATQEKCVLIAYVWYGNCPITKSKSLHIKLVCISDITLKSLAYKRW